MEAFTPPDAALISIFYSRLFDIIVSDRENIKYGYSIVRELIRVYYVSIGC